jgi:endonuclease/exonuclease/phosphatase family metal-dependent hydrolase
MKGRLFREAEVKGLIAIYQRLQSQYSVPIIIGGDFNADIKSDEFKRLTQLKLVNLHDLLQSNEEEKTTLVYFNYEEVPSNNQIDYFLIPQSLLAHVDKTESYTYRYKGFYDIPNDLPKTLTERYGMPSDHYPTVLTLILNKN